MAQTWTTSELLEAIREVGRIPQDSPDATDAILLREANRQMAERFVPLVRKVRAEFYVTTQTYSLTADRAAYDIPSRAATSSVRAVFLLDGDREYELTPGTLSDRFGYAGRSGTPSRYAVEDDQLVLMPAPNSAAASRYSLKVKYEARPNTLVAIDECGILTAKTRVSATVIAIQAEDLGTGDFATTMVEGDSFDVFKAGSPFSVLFPDATWTSTSMLIPQITVDGDTYRGAVGDYIAPVGSTPIPQLPAEVQPWLVKAILATWYKPLDPVTSADFANEVKAGLDECVKLLAPRNQGRQQKMRGSSLMRRYSSSRRGGTFDDWE